jgi:DNA-binding transcriptional LysR family regulator
LFTQRASDVGLNLHVATLNGIERGVLDGQFHIGIIPGHRNSDTLQYSRLFDENMRLYCGAGHALFGADHSHLDWEAVRALPFAGLGYHSPNLQVSQRLQLTRMATGFDQESIATLILSGCFLGFLPDHYAQSFVARGQMQAVKPDVFQYDCEFFAITRRSPVASRATRAFLGCLEEAHAAQGVRGPAGF